MATLKQRLVQYKQWKLAKTVGRPACGDKMLYVGEYATPGFSVVSCPRNPLIPSNEFDFPDDSSELRHKHCWASSLKSLECCFRNIQTAHDVNHRLEVGWYADEDCDETYVGYVLQLPARSGQEQWLGFVKLGDECSLRISLEVFDCAEDAARDANDDARILADEQRDYEIEERERIAAEELAAEVTDDIFAQCRASVAMSNSCLMLADGL